MPVRHVTTDDCGRLEGRDIAPLYSAVVAACPGLAGEALWEKIRKKYSLGLADDCENWVIRMNQAINIWNQRNPSNCQAIASAFGI